MPLPAPNAAAHAAASGQSGVWVWIILAALAVLAILGVWAEHHLKKKLQAFAASRGLIYVARDDRWAQIDTGYPYGYGRAHRARHVMTGQHRGRPIVIFEHVWTTGSGKNKRTHRARKTLMGLPKPLPRLEVRREGIVDRAVRRMGVKDIELESDAFNRAYNVAGQRRFAYDVLHPRFMQWMLNSQAPGFVINGHYIALFGQGRINVQLVDRDVSYLDAIIEQLPRYVVG